MYPLCVAVNVRPSKIRCIRFQLSTIGNRLRVPVSFIDYRFSIIATNCCGLSIADYRVSQRWFSVIDLSTIDCQLSMSTTRRYEYRFPTIKCRIPGTDLPNVNYRWSIILHRWSIDQLPPMIDYQLSMVDYGSSGTRRRDRGVGGCGGEGRWPVFAQRACVRSAFPYFLFFFTWLGRAA